MPLVVHDHAEVRVPTAFKRQGIPALHSPLAQGDQLLRRDACTEVELLDVAVHKGDVLRHLDVVHAP